MTLATHPYNLNRPARWSARVGLHYRALAVEDGGNLLWVWIGTHSDYDRLVQAGRS